MRVFFQILGGIFFALTALSFLGAWHPLFDSLAVFRLVFWFFAGLSTFFFVAPYQIWARFAIVMAAIPFVVLFDDSQSIDAPALRIFQHNLLYSSTAPDMKMLVKQLEPDVFTLQEIKSARMSLQELTDYSERVICDFETVGDIGILSKFEMVDQGCASGKHRGFAWARIQNAAGQEVTIVSMHLHWPFPYSQAAQLEELLPQLRILPRPIVLAGDINQVAWSHAAKEIEDAINAPILRGLRFTLVRPPLLLPIDHVFAEGVHSVERLERYGSDHNALLVDFKDWPQNN